MASKKNRKHQTSEPIYRDPRRPVEMRVRDLLSRMTLDDKIRQMGFVDACDLLEKGKFTPAKAKKLCRGVGFGGMQEPRQATPKMSAEAVNAIQKYVMESTHLGIPVLMTGECLHGHMSPGATVFPQAIGLGCTWNTELIREMTAVIGREARAAGCTQALSPDLDLAREPRWGRVEETYGEDPYHVARMGVAYVKGLQGEGPRIGPDRMATTLKHFAAHGSPESGINLSPVAVGPRELRSLFLPPFKACVIEGGALSVMPAYSDFDGIPCSANKELLTKILREEWGFRGYTFSDYGAIGMLENFHHTAADPQEAGRQALEAGMDLEAPGVFGFGDALLDLVKKGKVAMELVDRAVSRILRVKFLLGLFENPWANPKEAARITNCSEHRDLARRIAHETIVLLKNEKNLLPLDKNRIRSIAVIGPNADRIELGDYTLPKPDAVTPLQGIRNAAGRGVKVTYTPGCELVNLSKDGIAEAVSAARDADVAIIVVGESSMKNYGIGWGNQNDIGVTTSGEGFDRTELDLPGVQEDLVEAVTATGTPTVVVVVSGRPNSISWIAEHVPAVLHAWYPGEEGGHALADVLFGKVNPSGKLSITVPRAAGQSPVFYNHKPSARGFYHRPGSRETPGRDYVFMTPAPLYEFGFGLSYTQFKYANLRVSPSAIAPGGKVTASVDVKNAGKRAGKEVVQLYVRDLVSSVTTPVKSLRGFRKIDLKPGQTKTVEFTLGPEELALVDQRLESVVEPGDFEVTVGGLKKRFKVK